MKSLLEADGESLRLVSSADAPPGSLLDRTGIGIDTPLMLPRVSFLIVVVQSAADLLAVVGVLGEGG